MVISYSFFANNSIGELVQEGIEGFIFKDSTSLTELFLVTSKNRKQSARVFNYLILIFALEILQIKRTKWTNIQETQSQCCEI